MKFSHLSLIFSALLMSSFSIHAMFPAQTTEIEEVDKIPQNDQEDMDAMILARLQERQGPVMVSKGIAYRESKLKKCLCCLCI